MVEFDKLGSLSSDDGNGNENCKKAIGLDNKTTNMHLHHRPFLYIKEIKKRDKKNSAKKFDAACIHSV